MISPGGRFYWPILVVALLLLIGWLGTNAYVRVQTNRTSLLDREPVHPERVICIQQAAGLLPGRNDFFKDRFEGVLESRLDAMVVNYLSNKMEYEEIESCLNLVDQAGLTPPI